MIQTKESSKYKWESFSDFMKHWTQRIKKISKNMGKAWDIARDINSMAIDQGSCLDDIEKNLEMGVDYAAKSWRVLHKQAPQDACN